jgi:hypothetical protein
VNEVPLVKPHPCDRETAGTARHRHLRRAERIWLLFTTSGTFGLTIWYLIENGHF